MNTPILALIALVPVMIGPLPEAERSITAQLCSGGSVTIPLGNRDDAPSGDCLQKACHAGNCRKQFDLAQRRGGT
jgi:hypothetical protein